MAALKAAAKAEIESKKDKTKYSDCTRNELIEKSKEYKLPVKRKNQDMVDALLKYDEKHINEDEKNNSESENTDSE